MLRTCFSTAPSLMKSRWAIPLFDRAGRDATAPVLAFLARRLAGTGAGFLAASRTAAAGFFERTGLAELELQPLDEVTAGRGTTISIELPLDSQSDAL